MHTSTQPAAPADDGALITATEAKRLAGSISDMTLWRWHRAGVIPDPIKIRSRKYWNRGTFLAALARADQSAR